MRRSRTGSEPESWATRRWTNGRWRPTLSPWPSPIPRSRSITGLEGSRSSARTWWPSSRARLPRWRLATSSLKSGTKLLLVGPKTGSVLSIGSRGLCYKNSSHSFLRKRRKFKECCIINKCYFFLYLRENGYGEYWSGICRVLLLIPGQRFWRQWTSWSWCREI